MENIRHCAVIVRRPGDIWEGTRTTLGLAAHNFWAYLFVLESRIEMTRALRENMEWLEEMECPVISDMADNQQYGCRYMSLEEIGRELKKMDLVIPFGDRQ